MGLELLSKVFPFKVRHKPGYRMRVRVGIDSGPCTAGIIGDKLPHYSVFGETVEIAGVMEASSEPMKIQVQKLIACDKDAWRLKLMSSHKLFDELLTQSH